MVPFGDVAISVRNVRVSDKGLLAWLTLCVAAMSAPGCWVAECDSGQIEKGGVCVDLPPPAATPDDAAASSSDASPGQDAATSTVVDTFGKTCASDPDCAGGNAPMCGGPLAYCIQINCDVGEANAGVCPTGWMCLPKTSNPQGVSACIKSQ